MRIGLAVLTSGVAGDGRPQIRSNEDVQSQRNAPLGRVLAAPPPRVMQTSSSPSDKMIGLVVDATPSVSRDVPPRWIADPGTVGMAVFDATCLFSKHTRHLLLGFSVHGIVLGRWSSELLAEAAGSLARNLRGDSLEDLGHWLKHETDLVRDGLVDDYRKWLEGLTLPDPDDAHVLAAAIASGATVIVTDNGKDFPATYLGTYGITIAAPDEFSVSCVNANPVLATRVVTDHPQPELFLDKLAGQLPMAAALLRDLLD